MEKVPTLFKRDPDNMKTVLREVNPECEWVLLGEGIAARKYDGTCVMYDGAWWTRREVKPNKDNPPGFKPVQYDPATGKTFGWEPAQQESFWKYLNEAIRMENSSEPQSFFGGTYELCGPKIQGNPEGFNEHVLVAHRWAERLFPPLEFSALRDYLQSPMFSYEGIVWHHPDGRMAKLKRRDFT